MLKIIHKLLLIFIIMILVSCTASYTNTNEKEVRILKDGNKIDKNNETIKTKNTQEVVYSIYGL